MPDIKILSISFDNSADEKNLKLWENYVKEKDTSFGYALPTWMNIFKKAFGHETFGFMALENEKVVGILPVTHVKSMIFGSSLCSIPFVNYGGIISDSMEVSQMLSEHAQNLRAELKVSSIELRHMHACGLDLPAKANHKVSMILDLPETSELLWKSFKDKVRNQVRKAQKNGLTNVRGGIELLDDFYSVFCVNMRDLGTPVYAKSFFRVVLEHLPKETEIICVYREGVCIAAGVLYRYGDTMQMPWASSLLEHRSFCPNHSLYWEALSISADEGYKYFDFGRSTPNSGPWSFKKQWGVREVPLYWEYLMEEGGVLPALSNTNPKFQMVINMWKKLPLCVANTLGPKIVRGIP